MTKQFENEYQLVTSLLTMLEAQYEYSDAVDEEEMREIINWVRSKVPLEFFE